MNAKSDNIRDALVDHLSSFETGLDSKTDDVKMLAEIQQGITSLLGSTGGNEAEIRRVLQERYESGNLRKETFQLVKSMLDRYATEQVPAHQAAAVEATVTLSPQAAPFDVAQNDAHADDPMRSTTVIPGTDAPQADSVEARMQIGSVLRDRFMLQERVAGGSMGTVYKALDRRLAEGGQTEPWVAIKILSPQLAKNGQALRALQQEAAKGRCLTHPNIVRVMDLDRDDDLYFIVMEWLEGRTLADLLDAPNASGIDNTRAFKIVEQVGNALDYAHRCGIVHADVKPANIMIMPNGDAKLFDFGVARVQQKHMAEQPDFDPGVLGLLTPAYSSMQVLTGEEPTPADDVFSLGCLLYRLLAGYRVFGPRNAAEAAEEGMRPQRLEALSDAQWRVLNKALSYSRVTRFDSMSDFIEALHVDENEPITITVPIRDELEIDDDKTGAVRYIVGLVVLIGLLGAATVQFGLLDFGALDFGLLNKVKQQFAIGETTDRPESLAAETSEISIDDAVPGIPMDEAAFDADVKPNQNTADTAEPAPDPGAATPSAANSAPSEDATANAVEETALSPDAVAPTDTADANVAVADSGADLIDDNELTGIIESAAEAAAAESTLPLVDFSQLPRPTTELQIALGTYRAASKRVTLRENGRPVTIDVIRDNVSTPLTLRVEEVRYSGNRSPWESGQYTFSGNGVLDFPAGQTHARLTLTMTPDPLREADQQSTLRLREADSAASEVAVINVTLEDDDQRSFERTLPANTVAFAASQISVREQDPAVQIDILRFNPDDTKLVVGYAIRDITATQGEDYFAPSGYTIEFGPGQRTARLLIPLVQDSHYEDNEAFSLELSTADSAVDSDIYLRTAIMIRDDDT